MRDTSREGQLNTGVGFSTTYLRTKPGGFKAIKNLVDSVHLRILLAQQGLATVPLQLGTGWRHWLATSKESLNAQHGQTRQHRA